MTSTMTNQFNESSTGVTRVLRENDPTHTHPLPLARYSTVYLASLVKTR